MTSLKTPSARIGWTIKAVTIYGKYISLTELQTINSLYV